MYNIETIIYFLFLSLACFRITNMFFQEAMPFYIGIRIRHLVGIRYPNYENGYFTLKEVIYNYQQKILNDSTRISNNGLAELFNCFWCLSVWFAFVLVGISYLFPELGLYLILSLCVSAGSIIIKEKF